MALRIPAKVLLHVWSYDFYEMTLSTGKQRRHMIKNVIFIILKQFGILNIYQFAATDVFLNFGGHLGNMQIRW